MKADWAERLAGLHNSPDAIKHALETQGAKPPNVIEFHDACNRAPIKAMFALPQPKADQTVIDKAIARAQKAFMRKGDILDPIRNLRRREMEGDKSLTQFQRDFWRIALKSEMESKQ